MKASVIRVPAHFYGAAGAPTAEFKLGLGRCGKTVSALTIAYDINLVHIRQDHTDGTFKVFSYAIKDLHGRIEVEYTEA